MTSEARAVGAGTGMRRLGRPRDVALDDRILDATLDLLAERGFEHTTMDDVAHRAAVAKATVYRRYPSKEDLAVDAVRRLFERQVAVPDTGSLRGDLEQVYADLLAFAVTPQGQALVRLAVTESCRDARVGAMYLGWLRRREAACQVVFDRAVERGELRPDTERRLLFEWIPGVLVLRAVMGDEPLSPDDAPELVALILRGAAPA